MNYKNKSQILIIILLMLFLLCSCSIQQEQEMPVNPQSKTVPESHETQQISKEVEIANDKEALTITLFDYTENNWRYYTTKKDAFLQNNSNVDVKINYYPVPKSRTDTTYSTRLATDLMSGTAADLIMVNNTPFTRYARQGYFDELSSYIDSDKEFSRDFYYPNILEGMETDGKLYQLFTMIGYRVLLLNTDYADLLSDKLSNKYALTYQEVAELCDFVRDTLPSDMVLYPTDSYSITTAFLAEKWVFYNMENGYVNFDQRAFDLIDFVTPYVMPGMDAELPVIPDQNALFSEMGNPIGGNYPASSGSFQGGSWMLVDSEGNIPFYGVHSFAINATSSNKELAWEYLKYLTENVQDRGNGLMDFSNLPARRDEYWANFTEIWQEGYSYEPDSRFRDDDIAQSEFERMDKFHQMLSVADEDGEWGYGSYGSIVVPTVRDYALGILDAEGLVNRLNEKLTLYVNE